LAVAFASQGNFEREYQQNERDLQDLVSNIPAASTTIEPRFKEALTASVLQCGCSCCPCGYSSCVAQRLSRQDRVLLQDQNREQMKKLHPSASTHLYFLLSKLDEEDIYIKLQNPVPNGHAIRYVNLQGNDADVVRIAKDMGLRAFDNQIETPLHGEYVGGKTNLPVERKYDQAPQNFHKTVYRPLTVDQKREIDLNNEQELNKVTDRSADIINKFVSKLEAYNTFIKLYSAIQGGHTVDYNLISGSTASIQRVARKFHSLSVNHASITVDPRGDHVVAEAEEGDIHYADTVNPAQNTPVCASSSSYC